MGDAVVEFDRGPQVVAPIDELNDLLAAAEDRLAALNLGVRAGVALDERTKLIFSKQDGAWGIFVQQDGIEKLEPVLECSKLVRVAAAARLGDLLKQMRVEADEESRRVREAIDQVRGFLSVLEQESR